MSSLSRLKENLLVSMNKEAADLVIENVKIVNVISEDVTEGSILCKNGIIVAVNPSCSIKAEQVYDGRGQYAIPGLMDAHIHIDSTLLTPEGLAELIVPCGTTGLFVDPMEIANVAGIEGVKSFLEGSGELPYHIFLEVPSRVPTAPGLETTGGVLGVDEVKELLKLPMTASLGELDPAKILQLKEEYLEKVISAREAGKVANGHSIGLDWDQLNTYALAGLSDDHECVNITEVIERLRLGIAIMVREGSTERNLNELISGILENKLPIDSIMFCTDDKHPDDIEAEGHINFNVNRAIELGMGPIKAIRLATFNIAKHFRMDHLLGSLTPGRWADILLVKDLSQISPTAVFKEGRLVAEAGRLIDKKQIRTYPDFLYKTVKVSDSLSPHSFEVKAQGDQARVRVINIYPQQIINYETIEALDVQDGNVQVDVDRDILKLAVVERYGKEGNVGVGFVKGFGLKHGALAGSVSHDHHNIVVVGTNNEDMYLAAKEVEKHQGGLAAVSRGKVLDVLPLPIAGLMSTLPVEDVLARLKALNSAATDMGSRLPAPFMTLSFISLPTVPELGLTDKGLIKVLEHKIVPTVVGA